MKQTHLACLLALLIHPIYSLGETDQEAIVRATAAVQAAAARAQADPWHPVFHVAAPAQWMNDPNGPLFYKGFYHLFYQLTPFSDESGVKYWGHVRSRDLVKWEHLPIAIAPSGDKGEDSIWSGCCTINGEGRPVIFYTSIGTGKSAFDQAVQWAAVGDDDLIRWQKSPANPVLDDSANGGTKIYDWRDPFVFHAGKKTFLILGGHLARDKQAAVNIYEAENPELTRWKYRGPLFQIPDAPTVECPNFFQLGDKWVLFISPYNHVQYFVGDFDPATCRFTARTNGLLDCGTFYAPNTMLVPDGRRLVWGWVNGFPNGRGWNGCLSLPRQLGVAKDGRLRQTPAPQLAKLRGKTVSWRNVRLKTGSETFRLPETSTLEIQLDLVTAKKLVLEITDDAHQEKPARISFDGAQLSVLDAKAPLAVPGDNEKELKLRIFLDRSVLEVFANETVCVTKVIEPLKPGASLTIRAEDDRAAAKRVEAWPMKTIW